MTENLNKLVSYSIPSLSSVTYETNTRKTTVVKFEYIFASIIENARKEYESDHLNQLASCSIPPLSRYV